MNPSNPLIWEFSQFWLSQPESAFAPGRVSIGCDNTDLLVRADLHDAHVMRDEHPFSFPAFTKCDAFEIFLGPAHEASYFKFHVTPANGVLQIYFEGTGEKKSLNERAVADPLFTSETAITAEGWSVSARIPLAGLFPGSHPEWILSFGRYDYTPGQAQPVISSTSPHTVCNFHRKEEWRKFVIENLK